jgi:hypothetical protein
MANKLSREEVAAKWIYGMSLAFVDNKREAKAFYKKLSNYGKVRVMAMLRELDQAKPSRKERK